MLLSPWKSGLDSLSKEVTGFSRNQSAPKERRRRRAEKRSSKRVYLVHLSLIKLVRISGLASLFLAIAVLSAHFAREC